MSEQSGCRLTSDTVVPVTDMAGQENCECEARLSKPKIRWLARQILAAARAQVQLSWHNIEDVMPIPTVPLLTLVSMAILVHSGRQDLGCRSLARFVIPNAS